MRVERTSSAVLTVRLQGIKAGWEQWVLLRSDAHHDSPKCNRQLEKRHLDEMVSRDGLWADFGDLFDAMQGKFDPRRNYDEVRPEDKSQDYYDSIGRHAASFYAPYADRCLALGVGNHETGVLKNVNINLTDRLVNALNGMLNDEDNGHRILTGKYGGWIRFLFEFHTTSRSQIRLRYLHGYGGGAPVTKGVIQTNRQAVYLPDANIVLNGHNHNAYILPLARLRLDQKGKQYKDIQWHGRIPGYKDDFEEGTGGHAVEQGEPPKPLGALWLRFWMEGGARIGYKLETEISGGEGGE